MVVDNSSALLVDTNINIGATSLKSDDCCGAALFGVEIVVLVVILVTAKVAGCIEALDTDDDFNYASQHSQDATLKDPDQDAQLHTSERTSW